MSDQQKIAFKNELKQLCQSMIQKRIEAVKSTVESAQQAANLEEKSSAGDKYETSRAMNHLEQEMHSRQLAENLKELATLHSIDASIIYTFGHAGSFLECSGISFFIAAGLGKQTIDSNIVFFLSPHAPLARSLQNKKAGDSFLFNTTLLTIVDVY
ncbi:MAG: hypothetical protein H7122_02055 [Chitinophagaceae bacterium]|nr:hypothetical protein [Chitinophagaceae bacterium]